MSQKKSIGNIFNADNIALLIFILVSSVAFLSLFMVQYSHDDAGYYFKYAQEVANGCNGMLYKDIKFNYSPLPIYLYSMVINITKETHENAMFLVVNYIFILGTCFFIYKIFEIQNIPKSYSLIAISIYIISIIGIGSNSTEHFVAFFEVLMIFLLLAEKKISYLLAGISAFLAFYSKQYGLIYIGAGGLYFLFSKVRIKKLPYFVIGLLIPNIILFFFYNSIEGYSIFDLYKKLLFPQTTETVLTGEGYNFDAFIKSFIYFAMIVPYSFIAAYIYFSKKLFSHKPINFFLLFGILSFAPFLLASELRYYLLILPFVILFSLSVFKEYDFKNKSLNSIIFISLIISIISSLGALYRVRKVEGHYAATRTVGLNPNAVLNNDCSNLNKIIPRGSKVFIVDSQFYYYPADFYSIDLKNLGYTWAQQYPDINFILKYLDKGEYILVNPKSRYISYTDFVEKLAVNSPEFTVTKWVGNYHHLKPQNTIYYILYKKQ